MKKLIVALALVATGCATSSMQSGAETPARQRAKIRTELGSGYYTQGQLAISLDEFNHAVRIDPDYAPAHTGLGLVYASLGEDAKAESSFKRSLQLDPESSESHNNYGTFLCSRGRYDESVKEFLTAVRNPLYPTPEVAYLNAGICALKKNDDRNAESYLLNALQVQPGLRKANYHLAALYFERDDNLLARQHLQRAMLNSDPTPEMLWLGVRIERKLGGADAVASYSLLLKNKYPNSEQTKALLSGE